MGVYLSTPNTEKISSDETCQGFKYGASSMQGWRMAQEDAHNCLLEFDENTALFAVYDGHGGAEVAQYCAANLPQYIKETKSYKEGRFNEALEEAFLGFDAILTTPKIVQELKVLAGVESDDEGDPAKSIKQQTEAELLRQEADMPIEELMAKYEGEDSAQPRTRILRKKTQVNSPVIKPRKFPFPQNASEQDIDTNENSEVKLEDKISNGHAENENNINLEKESQMSSSLSSSTSSSLSSSVQQDVVSSSADNSSKLPSEDPSQSCSSSSQKEEATSSTADGSSQKGLVRSKKTLKNLESSGVSSSDSTQTKETSSTGTKVNDSEISDGPSSSNTTEAACGSSSAVTSGSSSQSSGGSSSQSSGGSSGSSSTGSGGGSGSGSFFIGEPAAGGSSSNKNESAGSSSGINDDEDEDDDEGMEDYEDEDLSGSDDDEEFEAASDEDDESEDDEEIEEEDEDSYMAERTPTEEPGSDSGSTAVLAMIKNKKLYVANAGDSRCILSRGGKAIDMSVDHKPEDEVEKNRIEAAGGKVTEEGRVNGGLNLSRAIGDHFYKRNLEKTPKEQMITALPDIETMELQENDEFMVLACDGIWNYMTSQEVVDFVKEKMKEEENKKQLSLICEKLFDKCLAPNTLGDGTGCDNMTCIVVTFDQLWNNNKNKRPAEDNEEMSDKRRKTEELGT